MIATRTSSSVLSVTSPVESDTVYYRSDARRPELAFLLDEDDIIEIKAPHFHAVDQQRIGQGRLRMRADYRALWRAPRSAPNREPAATGDRVRGDGATDRIQNKRRIDAARDPNRMTGRRATTNRHKSWMEVRLPVTL